ncbi:substrate-binding domain-containing protein [Nonomuraea spiralis]|uniref:Substrate-binding domain-containing protein n=1 Tax=Nonomuraea spiralis TaxID=46182 RepID=A0ABV5ICC1_9ACTN|nr:substrate-binding domain-containing protein [Nonomuraea spiralis]GGS78392.1 hypothetical protein GCM10010176_021900 [Nonomuraea spiralis]
MRRARPAAEGITGVLRVGMIPHNSHDLRRHWDTFRGRHPEWKLQIRISPFADPFAGLRRSDIDVLVAWLPVEELDLITGPVLFTDPRLLAVATDHELTRHTTGLLEMLADFPHVDAPSRPGYWADGFLPSRTPRAIGSSAAPLARNTEEILSLVTTGVTVSLVAHHMRRYYLQPDITYLPLRDDDPLKYALVWSAGAENDMIRALAQTVRDLGPLDLLSL